MRTIIFRIALLLIMAISSLGGCSYAPTPYLPTKTQIYSSSTPTIPLPSATFTPSITLSPSDTATVAPTLSADDAMGYVVTMMTNSGTCQLPCWMGVSPGQPATKAKDRLASLDSITENAIYGVSIDNWVVNGAMIDYPIKNATIKIETDYLSPIGGTSVSVIGFTTYVIQEGNSNTNSNIAGNPDYEDFFRSLTISEILSKYGIPDQIYILGSLRSDTLPQTPGWGDYFAIFLWYPAQGIFMEYEMGATDAGVNYKFCPSAAHISGNLMQGDTSSGYLGILGKLGKTYQSILSGSIYIKKPTDALGLTNKDFYQLFHDSTTRCLETPKSIWWPK